MSRLRGKDGSSVDKSSGTANLRVSKPSYVTSSSVYLFVYVLKLQDMESWSSAVVKLHLESAVRIHALESLVRL